VVQRPRLRHREDAAPVGVRGEDILAGGRHWNVARGRKEAAIVENGDEIGMWKRWKEGALFILQRWQARRQRGLDRNKRLPRSPDSLIQLERGDEAPSGGARTGLAPWAVTRRDRDIDEDERGTLQEGSGRRRQACKCSQAGQGAASGGANGSCPSGGAGDI
jgi:hypothetical protein